MQFILKWEAEVEVGMSATAPLSCKARLGVALDDQPTACLFGSREPARCIEGNHSSTGKFLQPYVVDFQLF